MKHSFKEAYDVLQRHAATLRTQSEPNIDDLLRVVEESVAAYKTCQTRIDAVEKALDKALSQLEPSAEEQEPAVQASSANSAEKEKPSQATQKPVASSLSPKTFGGHGSSGFDDMDDDIF